MTIFQFAGWVLCHSPLALEPLDAVGREPLGQPGHLLGERLSMDVEVHEDEPAERLDACREQPQLGLVEIGDRAPLGHADQLAVEAVGPAVVEAADRLAALARAVQQARAAVAADVAEGPQPAVVGAQHEHRLHAGRARQVVAGVRELGHVGHQLPGAGEDPLLLQLRQLGVAVEARVERRGQSWSGLRCSSQVLTL